VKPVITYGAESLVTAKDTTMHKLETIQNRILRSITGAVETTNTTAMRMYTDSCLVQKEIEKKACTMHMRLAALPTTLRMQSTAPQNLTTQPTIIRKTDSLLQQFNLDDKIKLTHQSLNKRNCQEK
jgi:hypothetical protein